MTCCAYEPDIFLADDHEYSVAATTESCESSAGSEFLSTTYQHVTPLFRAIEKEDWEGILIFLNTSKWSDSFFVSTEAHMVGAAPHIQCKTWVTCYDDHGREEWTQLPLHGAINYGAPAVVIQKLVDVYPAALTKGDKDKMLPIHLAFGFVASDAVLSLLLKAYPASAQQRGPGGRLPYQCCELGSNKKRGEVFGVVAEQTALMARQEQEVELKNCVRENMTRLQLEEDKGGNLQTKELSVLLTELLEDRKQLRDLKQKLKGKFGTGHHASSGATEVTPVKSVSLKNNTSKSPSSKATKSSKNSSSKNSSSKNPSSKNSSSKDLSSKNSSSKNSSSKNSSSKSVSASTVSSSNRSVSRWNKKFIIA